MQTTLYSFNQSTPFLWLLFSKHLWLDYLWCTSFDLYLCNYNLYNALRCRFLPSIYCILRLQIFFESGGICFVLETTTWVWSPGGKKNYESLPNKLVCEVAGGCSDESHSWPPDGRWLHIQEFRTEPMRKSIQTLYSVVLGVFCTINLFFLHMSTAHVAVNLHMKRNEAGLLAQL